MELKEAKNQNDKKKSKNEGSLKKVLVLEFAKKKLRKSSTRSTTNFLIEKACTDFKG